MTTDTATPDPRPTSRPGRPKRGPKYPAQLAVMVTAETRDRIDEVVSETGASLGEVVRALIDDGFAMQEAGAS